MSLTLGLTGMDPATEAALKAAFLEANARLGNRWTLVSDGEADHVVVDMDSMYGPMSWLRLHAAGRQVIGLTSAPRTQTDFRLGRPFDTDQVMTLLADVARGAGVELEAGSGTPEPAPPQTSATNTAPQVQAKAEPEEAAAPAPAAATPEPPPVAAAAPIPVPVVAAKPDPEPSPPAAEPAAAAEPAPAPPTGQTLANWLQSGALTGRVRYQRGDAPALLIDADADSWHGPTALKSLASCFEGAVEQAELLPVDDATWSREAAGAAQPLARLRWLGGLLAGQGELLPGLDPHGRFQLNKWPQTEREYPRHFRIATQMMKGPATVAEIAEASGVPASDVADFVNANLATGFAEPWVEPPPSAEEPAKSRGGLLGRLRSR